MTTIKRYRFPQYNHELFAVGIVVEQGKIIVNGVPVTPEQAEEIRVALKIAIRVSHFIPVPQIDVVVRTPTEEEVANA